MAPSSSATTLPALWRDQPAHEDLPVLRARRRRRRTLLLLGLGLLAAATTLLFLSWLREIPRTTFVPLWLAPPRAPGPPAPAWSAQDRAGLRQFGLFGDDERLDAGLDRAQLVQEINQLPARSSGSAVVVHLAGVAHVRGGEVVLLPADADPTDDRDRVPLRDVLRALAAVPQRHKLLILDLFAPRADMRFGWLIEGVAATVQNDLDAVPDRDRLVLCACSPGQTAHASEDLRRSVFSYYLEEGLRGHADGWNPSGARDRRVSVQELARYVRSRVRLWARHNRQEWQTPQLLGDAADFPLVLLGREPPGTPELPAAPAADMPEWLRLGWEVRQRLWDAGTFRADPLTFRRLDALLLTTERRIHEGGDVPGAVELANRLKRLEAPLQRAVIPLADVPSLGLMERLGRPPEAKTVDLLKDLLDPDRQAPAPGGEKPAGPPAPPVQVLESLKGKPHYEVAVAVFDLAEADPAPRPERLRFLDAVLRAQEPHPQYAETLWLRRLAVLAEERLPADWPEETVRHSLDAVRLGERAGAEVDARPWVAGLLETGFQHLHEGQVFLLGGRGYVAPDLADRSFLAAAEAFRISEAHALTVQRAQAALDHAFPVLAAYADYLEGDPRPERAWFEALAAVDDLIDFLYAFPPPSASVTVYLRRDEELRQKLDAFESRLSDLRRLFGGERVAALTRERGGKVQFSSLVEIEALLATPLPTPKDRAALWHAARVRSRRLHEESLRLQDEVAPASAGESEDAVEPARQAQERAALQEGLRRARLSLGLLQLGGWPAAERQRLESLLDAAAARHADAAGQQRDLDALADGLRRAWAEVPERVRTDPSLDARDRLSWIAPLDRETAPLRSPRPDLRAERLRSLWNWRADRLRYEGRDLGALDLLSDPTARFFRRAARFFPQDAAGEGETQVTLTGPRTPLRVRPEVDPPPLRLAVHTLSGGGKPPPTTLRLLPPAADWFTATLGEPGQAPDGVLRLTAATAAVPLQLHLKQTDRGNPPPRGLLLEARCQGRSYHQRLPVNLRDVTDRLDILLATGPKPPTDGLDELRLRPLPGRQDFHLFVRNRSPRTRNLVVQLATASGPWPGGEAKLTLREGETLPVRFGAPPATPPPTPPLPPVRPPAAPTVPMTAPAPLLPTPTAPPEARTAPAKPGTAPVQPVPEAEELPELGPWLEIRLLDADEGGAAVETARIPVGVAAAAEYVQVAAVQFVPVSSRERGLSGAVNRLNVTLRAVPGLVGPPCQVEVALFSADGRTLLRARRGNQRGEVSPEGGDTLLTAEDVQIPPGSEGLGSVQLAVDGRQRAFVFRVAFVREGGALSPTLETAPAIRLLAPSSARTAPRFTVGLEIDNAPADATAELSLGRLREGVFIPDLTRALPAPQRRHVGFAPTADGLSFEASVRDWSVTLDTTRVVGRRHLQARLLDRAGNPLKTVLQPLLLDDSPPEGLRFLEPPTQARRQSTLTLTASAGQAESGIERVVFFKGRPTVDGKPPPGATLYPGEPVNPERTVWSVALPLEEPKTGPMVFSVRSTSGAGLDNFAETTIELTEGDPEGQKPGQIEGVVTEGEVPQPNLEVVLLDEKGVERGRTKTATGGKFTFDKVASGKYQVAVAKPATKRRGTATVFVEPGKTATATVKLLLP